MQYTIMDRGIKAFSKKKWDIAKPQLKICDAVDKEEGHGHRRTQQAVILALLGPVSHCVPSAGNGWHPYTFTPFLKWRRRLD